MNDACRLSLVLIKLANEKLVTLVDIARQGKNASGNICVTSEYEPNIRKCTATRYRFFSLAYALAFQ